MFVENDADAMAFGEHSAAAPACDALCLVKVSTGIRTGLVINGSVYLPVEAFWCMGKTAGNGIGGLCPCASCVTTTEIRAAANQGRASSPGTHVDAPPTLSFTSTASLAGVCCRNSTVSEHVVIAVGGGCLC